MNAVDMPGLARLCRAMGLGWMLFTVGGLPALAADAASGAQLARQWCASCHAIGGDIKTPVPQGPPAFRAIARNGPGGEALRAFLAHPHGAMPDLSLTRNEIENLAAYIETLQ